MKTKNKGQGLVEFALILPLLLLVVFLIIEAARAFQAWNMLRNSAEDAVRYAVTGQQESGISRLESIKTQAVDAVRGLPISVVEVDGEPYINYDTPDALIVRVFGGNPPEDDNPGGPGERVLVEACYNFRLLTPFFADRAPFLRVCGSAEMINEDFGGLLVSQGGSPPLPPPPLPAIPTLGPSPIDILEPLRHGDTQVQGTGHPSMTVQLTIVEDPSVNQNTTVQGDGTFVFSGLSGLIGGHTVQVDGLAPYNSADSAQVLPVAPIDIQEPLVQGDTTVQGTAHPNEILTINDLDDGGWSENGATATVDGAGNYVFNLASGLQDGHTIEVSGYSQSDQAVVITAVPIVIQEPLLPGEFFVRGWAKPGAILTLNDLSGSWSEDGILTQASAGGSFVFYLGSGLPGGHTIEVSGYGEADTAIVLAPTPTPVPIVIDEPVREGALVVSGRGKAGAIVRLRDLDDQTRTIDLETRVRADGTYTFDLSGVAPGGLTVGHELVVQGYGQEAFTTVQPLPPTTHYIELEPTCQDVVGRSAGILVKGFNWPIDRGDIIIYWDGAATAGLTPSSPDWQKFIFPFAHQGTHTIYVETERNSNTYNATATYEVPCPTINRANSPVDLTISGVSIVDTPPYTSYTPLNFNVVVHNPTTSVVNSLFWVDLYVDPVNRPIIARNLRAEPQGSVDYQAVGILGAGGSITLTMQHTDGVTSTGQHTYYALADTFDQVPEFDEDNNVFTTGLVITVTGVGVPPTPTPVPTTQPPSNPGSISGVTYRNFNRQGGVTVILYRVDTGLEVARTQSAPGQGTYQFTGLAPYFDYFLDAQYRQGNTTYCGSATVASPPLQPNENRVKAIVLISCSVP
jgi:hypothetical protein